MYPINEDVGEPDTDASLDSAVSVIAEYDRATASLLQRRLSIDPTEAAHLIEGLRAAGYLERYQAGSWSVRREKFGQVSGRVAVGPSDDMVNRVLYRIGNVIVIVIAVVAIAIGGNWLLTVGLRQPDRPIVQRESVGETACLAAFRDASDGSVLGNVEYDLDPAMSTCASLGDWSAAFGMFPTIGAGDDPRFVAENRCMTGRFSDTAICRELDITP